jgi:hypothetical protein
MTEFVPRQPFEGYKWRWAALTPTESLNKPSVYIGVLRAFKKFEHSAPSNSNLAQELLKVQNETGTTVDLVRTPDRNLVRNSGQYWKALGLLDKDTRGEIKLTTFGNRVADGDITQTEFALQTIQTLKFPNRLNDSEEIVNKCSENGIEFRPLLLILEIISKLSQKYDSRQNGYLSPYELINIIIPASFTSSDPEILSDLVYNHRQDNLSIENWPKCCVESNDKRMAREYLLFLEYNGFLERVKSDSQGHYNDSYILSAISTEEIEELKITSIMASADIATIESPTSSLAETISRKKIFREILERPNQARFRKDVLRESLGICLITGVDLQTVLEAAHILPVSEGGPDISKNGLCLRSDIHQMFDAGELRILDTGTIKLSETAKKMNNYGGIRTSIIIPDYVDVGYINWRENYT